VPHPLRRLFDHLEWADDRVLRSLREAPAIPPKALELFAHVLGAEHVWLARLRQVPARLAVWPALDLEHCATVARENRDGYAALLDDLGADGLGEEVPYTNSAGASFRTPAEDILLHVALHGCYHRGQVAMLLRQNGAVPQPTDYIAFVRGAPAATRLPRT
jgi:uncharacterized damage-inducible protein DinB